MTVDLDFLHNYACWLIIDPFSKQPENDVKICPDIEDRNAETVLNISKYLKNCKHWLVSTYTNDIVIPFQNLENIKGNKINLMNYMKQNNLHHIVYTGFHDGCCILHQEFTGAKYMSKIYSCYMKQDLICTVPELFVDTTIEKVPELLQDLSLKFNTAYI